MGFSLSTIFGSSPANRSTAAFPSAQAKNQGKVQAAAQPALQATAEEQGMYRVLFNCGTRGDSAKETFYTYQKYYGTTPGYFPKKWAPWQ